MAGKFSRHIRSNAVGYVALFFALTGGAYALQGKNTVDSGDIRKGQVKTSDVANDNRKGALKGADIAADSLTGRDLDEASLATVPDAENADELDNLNSTDFLRSNAPAAGDLTGNYPNPRIAQSAVDSAKVLDGTLTGADLEPDGLTGANISESSLGQVPSALAATVAGVGRSNGLDSCDPESASFITCTFVTLNLSAQARVVGIGHASALAEAGQNDGTGRCRLATSATGEVTDTNSLIQVGNDTGDYENAALSGVTPPLGPGSVDVGIECLEAGGGAVIFQQTGITAVAISPN